MLGPCHDGVKRPGKVSDIFCGAPDPLLIALATTEGLVFQARNGGEHGFCGAHTSNDQANPASRLNRPFGRLVGQTWAHVRRSPVVQS